MNVPDPCPRCGSACEAVRGPVPDRWGVKCLECDLWADDRCDTEAEAIAAWNRRAALPAREVGVPTDAQVASACLSYRHDFGLMDGPQRKALMFEAREWLHAWRKEFAALAPTDAAQAPAEDAHVKGETAGQMLERLGMDGAKWAAEFRTTALRLGYSDMDEGWLVGWFCNAIMAGHDRSAAQAREAALHIENAKRLRRYDWQEWTAQDIEDAEGIICAYLALIGEARTDAAQAREAAIRDFVLREALAAVNKAREAVIHSGNRAYIDGISVGHDRAEIAILALIGEART